MALSATTLQLSIVTPGYANIHLCQKPGVHYTRPGSHPEVDAGGVYTSCTIERLGDETVFEFEREYTVRLRLLFPEEYREAFAVGSAVHFYEGSRPVGSGTIFEIL